MDDELKTIVYMMAAEKVCNMIFTIENTMTFMQEYQVKPDEEVKKAMSPIMEQLKKWIENESK